MYTWARRIALTLGFVAMIPLLMTAVPVLYAKFTGSQPYNVLTGSMAPTLQPGDLVVITPRADYSTLQAGDVIAFLPPESTVPITHRIIDVTVADGRPVFQTKGDANPIADNYTVGPGQILGEQTGTIPGLGRVLDGANGPLGWFVMFGMPLLWFLIAWAIGRLENREELEEELAEVDHEGFDGDAHELTGPAIDHERIDDYRYATAIDHERIDEPEFELSGSTR